MKKEVSKQDILFYRSCGILDNWHDKELSDFTNDDRALQIVKKYLKNIEDAFKDGTGIYLFGPNGVGKSLLLNASFVELVRKKYTCRVISMPTLITKYTAGWSSNEERKSFMQMLQSSQFLGIEELGKGTKTDLGNMVLESVVRYRVQMKKPIWITTNCPPSTIATLYSPDVSSMLKESCIDISVKGGDYRDIIQAKNNEKYK